ncbi:MAG TPA: arginase family protein [Gemmataceae bacterium]
MVFPFDLFGAAGTARGAELLADALKEMIADNRRERQPTRADAYQGKLRFREFRFETLKDYGDWRSAARQAARRAWERGEFLLWLSGNHLGVLPVYEALGEGPGREETLVVQFDAHLDVYNLADCTEELSHGNFLLHARGELPPVVNAGHRDLFLKDEHIRRHFRGAYPAADWDRRRGEIVSGVADHARSARRVFIDIDCDVFDPAFFPAAGQPLPFGLSPREVLGVIDAAGWERVGGLALSEFDPGRDVRDQSLGTLVWLLEYALLRRYGG